MWPTKTNTVSAMELERAEDTKRTRTALAMILANQVAEGRAADALILEEYRTADREHREAIGRLGGDLYADSTTFPRGA